MSGRPKLEMDAELRYSQIGEAWPLLLTFTEAHAINDWEPDSGTVTITHAGNGALSSPVVNVPMVLAGNTLAYTLPAGVLTAPEKKLKAIVTAVLGAEIWTYPVFFDAVRFSPRIPATMNDVAVNIPDIEYLFTGEDPDGEGALALAWRRVLSDIRRKGAYPNFVIDSEQLHLGLLYRTCFALYRRDVGNEDSQDAADGYYADYSEWLEELQPDLDVDESGTIEGDERAKSLNSFRFGRGVAE